MTNHGTMTSSATLTSGATSGTPATSDGPTARRLILYASAAVGLWVLASFGGTMLDPARAQLWTGSLMWSLLASLLISPALLVASPLTSDALGRSAKTGVRPVEPPSVAPSKPAPSEATASEATPFVGKGARLWPEPAELRERADLRRKAAAFEQAAFEEAERDGSLDRTETDRTPVAA